ncbi:MAG: exopolysaccharide biosynthesis protein [Bdellovibrionales bacterium]
MQLKKIKISEKFQELARAFGNKPIPIGEFVDSFGISGHAVFILILCIPFVTPVPIPGLSTLFGILIAIAGVRISFGLPPWVPQRWRKKEIPITVSKQIFSTGTKIMSKVELLTKPRLRFFSMHPALLHFNGFIIVMMAIVLALPLPPGTNFPPALAIVLMALGNLEEDGLIILLGYVVFCLNLLAIALISIYGLEGFLKLIS